MNPDQLAQEAKRLAVAYAEACAESAVDVGSARSHQWGAHLATPERALFAAIDALAKRAESAEALVEQYRLDAERLDWMSEHGLSMDAVADPDNLTVVFYGTHPCKQAYGRTFRDAIDAALQQEKSNA